MNLVGKILTVLIFVMSVVFASFAVTIYATHTNWYDMVMRPRENVGPGQKPGLKYQLEDAKAEKEQLDRQLEQIQKDLKSEQDARNSQVGQLESTVDQLRREGDAREKNIQDLNQRLAAAMAGLQTTQTNLTDLEAERQRLKKSIDQAQQERDAAFKESVTASDQVHQLENEQKRLEARLADLTVDTNRMRELLQRAEINPDADPASFLPDVDGAVLAAAGAGLLEISIGADDGLRKGHRLEVFRTAAGRSSYLGRVEVVQTAPDRAVCKILPEYRKGDIRQGDRVASKLN